MPPFSDLHAEAAHRPAQVAPPQQYRGYQTWSVEDLAMDAAPHGFRPAQMDELASAHQFSEKIMDMRLAPLWSLASAHAHTGGSAWIHTGPADPTDASGSDAISGVFLLLPLTWEGEAALRTRRFNYALPRLDELCAPGDEISAVYFWFCAGAGPEARRDLMRTTQAWLDGAFAGLRIYGRAASEEGTRALARFGFRRLAQTRPDLFILG